MKINLFCISKEQDFCEQISEFKDKILSFGAKFESFEIFNSKIAQAQKMADSQNVSSIKAAQDAYALALLNAFDKKSQNAQNRLNVALSPDGKVLDSQNFAQLFENKSEANFFIGGAWGFSKDFLRDFAKSHNAKVVSLSPLTMSHKIAKIVLVEQIYRALSIINNHPYHK